MSLLPMLLLLLRFPKSCSREFRYNKNIYKKNLITPSSTRNGKILFLARCSPLAHKTRHISGRLGKKMIVRIPWQHFASRSSTEVCVGASGGAPSGDKSFFLVRLWGPTETPPLDPLGYWGNFISDNQRTALHACDQQVLFFKYIQQLPQRRFLIAPQFILPPLSPPTFPARRLLSSKKYTTLPIIIIICYCLRFFICCRFASFDCGTAPQSPLLTRWLRFIIYSEKKNQF